MALLTAEMQMVCWLLSLPSFDAQASVLPPSSSPRKGGLLACFDKARRVRRSRAWPRRPVRLPRGKPHGGRSHCGETRNSGRNLK